MSQAQQARFVISGRVQGVWYRASTQERAVGLGLTGWVRNLPDGRVEVLAQGPTDRIQALIDWCRQGPPLARVERIDVDWQPPGEPHSGFAISR
ncbi:MAG: acylphosphatase [Proteobacteria bacterium]|nr:acylphosphatase [Pseudomonadota bacterium]MBU1740375.1 acylphosphatase [Pseudomonadota bacterium]